MADIATAPTQPTNHPKLLCFDGSDDAAAAIERAAMVLVPGPAVVLTVCEPLPMWEPHDPLTIIDSPLAKLLAQRLELDALAMELATAQVNRGVALAQAAGLEASGRAERGAAWRVICDVADELGTTTIVMGARGLSRVRSMILGSVSSKVLAHAAQPVLVVPGAIAQTNSG